MSRRRRAVRLIRELEQARLHGICPHCSKPFRVRDANLFYLDDFPPEAQERYAQLLDELKERRKELRQRKKDMVEGSERGAEAVNIGLVLERLAPAMDGFGYNHNDCRSIFDPIDYVIFDGLSENGSVERIIFAEIKTGNSRLLRRQRQVRDAVHAKKVSLELYETR